MKYYPFSLHALSCYIIAILVGCSQDATEPIEELADISLSQIVDQSYPYFGEEIKIILQVRNAGPFPTTGVVVTDIIPDGYTYVDDDGGTNTSFEPNSLRWKLPEMTVGKVEILTMTVKVNETGSYSNTASVTASDLEDPDSVADNNIDSEDDQETIVLEPTTQPTVQVETLFSNISAGDGLTIDGNGTLYGANYRESRVYQINPERGTSLFLQNQPGAAGLAIGPGGYLYLARYNSADIVKVSLTNNEVSVFATNVAGPIAIDFDSHGNLYTNNHLSNAITKIDPSGGKTVIRTGSYNNSSVTLDEKDNIYVSDYTSGAIKKITADTNEESIFTSLPIQNGVGFIIYHDNYFYATAIRDNAIFKIDMNGNAVLIAGILGEGGIKDDFGNRATFDIPNGLVISEDGKTMYVAQQGQRSGIRVVTGF